MSNESAPFYSETFDRKVTLIYDYLTEEIWTDKGVKCRIPEHFEILSVINWNTNKEVNNWEDEVREVYSEYLEFCENNK